MAKSRKPERFLLKVVRGGLHPADGYTQSRLREKGYHVGDVVLATISKPRRPKFHRLAHVFAKMVADNIDEFDGMDPHSVLKRLQYESGIGCEEMGAKVPGVGYVMIRIPKSLSFSSMDDGEFKTIFSGLARHVAQQYWHGLDEEQIHMMAETMPDET